MGGKMHSLSSFNSAKSYPQAWKSFLAVELFLGPYLKNDSMFHPDLNPALFHLLVLFYAFYLKQNILFTGVVAPHAFISYFILFLFFSLLPIYQHPHLCSATSWTCILLFRPGWPYSLMKFYPLHGVKSPQRSGSMPFFFC